jgi:glycosyltransferase involved in cell wall biosynthesis
MKISVCMITWNEETLLPVAIESVGGLADEIIVVDTGSSDKTIEVAQGLGCIVHTGADRMHKAESRNKAIEESTGDWVVILDADEQIADPAGLREFLETTDALTRLQFLINRCDAGVVMLIVTSIALTKFPSRLTVGVNLSTQNLCGNTGRPKIEDGSCLIP